jgi:hypothetical protein
MKAVAVVFGVALSVGSAQAGWFGSDEPAKPTQPAPHPYAMSNPVVRVAPQAPAWFVKLPEDTQDMVFAGGTGTSTDEQMAYEKARLAAERRLIERTNAVIRTQTKSYRADRGDTTIENFESVTRKNAMGELIGAQRVDSQSTFDGNSYKVYVLLRLPLGTANQAATEVRQKRLVKEADARSIDAHQEMDRNAHDAVESNTVPISHVTPVTVPTAHGEVKLLDVDNVEYKTRRDAALQKPGAVIGQTTVR